MIKRLIALVAVLLSLSQLAYGVTVGRINFKTLVPPDKPNYYLVCPKDFCQAKAQETSAVYPLSLDALRNQWQAMIAKQPRTKVTYTSEDGLHWQYVQRSLIFRFPDYINVQFISIDDKHSTLAVFSRSKYGYSDMGVNKKRVKNWLQGINEKTVG